MNTYPHDDQLDARGREAAALVPVLEREPPGHETVGVPLFELPVHIAVLDHDGFVVAVNDAWQQALHEGVTFGVALGGVGMDYLAVCRQAFGPYLADNLKIEARIRNVLDGTRQRFATEYPQDSPTGRRWFSLQVSPLPDALPGAVVVHVEITGRKLSEEEWASSLVHEQVRRAEREHRRTAPDSPRAAIAAASVAPASVAPASVAPASVARLRALEALTDTALSHLALDDLMRELLDRLTTAMRVDNAAILLLEDDGRTLAARAVRGPEESVMDQVRVPVGKGFAGRIAATRKPLLLDDLSTFEVATPLLREKLRSIVGVPLLVEDRLVGVIHVGSFAERHFTPEDVDLLYLVADRIAPAVERARLYAAERAARARTEEALARTTESEMRATERAEEFQTILETIADGVAVIDRGGHISRTNRAFCELLALDHLPGFETVLPAAEGQLMEVLDAAGNPVPYEQLSIANALRGEVVRGPGTDIHVRAGDGRLLELTTSAAPLRDRAGQIVGAVLVTRDVSWRRRLEREREDARASELALKETTQRLDEFLATAAHDLRSPLAVTMTAVDLAASRVERLAGAIANQNHNLAQKIGPIRSCLDDARQSVDRVSRMVTMLFDTAQVRAGTLKLHRRTCQLVGLVREQVDALRRANPNREIRLETPEDQPVRVVADRDRIGQVVMNYVTNAIKYSPDDEPVDVRVAVEGPLARVAVRDRGLGLPPDEQERIWQRFYRVRGVSLSSRQSAGLGLGLHISKTIVDLHGGQVGVESAVGAGSTFWFTLPTRLVKE